MSRTSNNCFVNNSGGICAPAVLPWSSPNQPRRRWNSDRGGGGTLADFDPVGYQHAGNERARTVARAKSLRPNVPIIMITAYGDAETKRKALEHGAELLLTKPIDFGDLRSEIELRVGSAA